jgi:hypothetical protein
MILYEIIFPFFFLLLLALLGCLSFCDVLEFTELVNEETDISNT